MLSSHLVVRQTFFTDMFMHHKKKDSKMPCATLVTVSNNEKLRAIQCEETMGENKQYNPHCHFATQQRKGNSFLTTFHATLYNPNTSLNNILSSLFCICDNIWVTSVLFPEGQEIEKQIFMKKNEKNNIKRSEHFINGK